jgi:hypothetical protein
MNDRTSNRGLQASSGWRDQLLTWNIPQSEVLDGGRSRFEIAEFPQL